MLALIGEDGTPCDLLVDTGSQRSILNSDFCQTSQLCPVKGRLIAVNGNTIPVLGEVRLRLRLGDMVVYHNFWVSDQIREGIIGNDFLSKHHAVLDLGKGEMNIRGSRLSLVSRPFTGKCNSLYEQYDDDEIQQD